MRSIEPYERVLGIYPCQTGFGFAVIERKRGLIDWGETELGRNTDQEFADRLAQLIRYCLPASLAIEECAGTARGARAKQRVKIARSVSRRRGMTVHALSATTVRRGMSLAPDAPKHALADRLCEIYPELLRHKPRFNVWARDPRMNVFYAVALATATRASR
jgi:hypothetical protein